MQRKRVVKYVLPPVDRPCHGRCPIDRWRGRPWPGRIPIRRFRARGSARQQFWLDHLRAWQAQGTSLRAYAAANGLSSSSLYRARRRLERRGLLSGPEEAAPAFVPVRVAPPAPACRVLLPNGVVVEGSRAHRQRAVCATVLECASRLR